MLSKTLNADVAAAIPAARVVIVIAVLRATSRERAQGLCELEHRTYGSPVECICCGLDGLERMYVGTSASDSPPTSNT